MYNVKYLGKKLNNNPELKDAFIEAYEKIIAVTDKMMEEMAESEEAESSKI